MQAVIVEEFGDPPRLVLRDVPTPEPGPGQLRIKVAAAGINPVDTYNAKDASWAGIDVRLHPRLRHCRHGGRGR